MGLFNSNGPPLEIEGKIVEIFSCFYLRRLLTRFGGPLTALKIRALRGIDAQFPIFILFCLVTEVLLPNLINFYHFKLFVDNLMITL